MLEVKGQFSTLQYSPSSEWLVNEVSEMGGPVNTTSRAGSSYRWGNCRGVLLWYRGSLMWSSVSDTEWCRGGNGVKVCRFETIHCNSVLVPFYINGEVFGIIV